MGKQSRGQRERAQAQAAARLMAENVADLMNVAEDLRDDGYAPAEAAAIIGAELVNNTAWDREGLAFAVGMAVVSLRGSQAIVKATVGPEAYEALLRGESP